jgi:hypothetical protein
MRDTTPNPWWRRLLCHFGFHPKARTGQTIAGFRRCYACSRNQHQDGRWSHEYPKV